MKAMRLWLLATAMCGAFTNAAKADSCPPGGDWTGRYMIWDSRTTGDIEIGQEWCGQPTDSSTGPILLTPDRRQEVIDRAMFYMDLEDNAVFTHFADQALHCQPTSWAMRFFNAARFIDMVSESREQDTLVHASSPRAQTSIGVVEDWLTQWIQHSWGGTFAVSGYVFACGDGSANADNYAGRATRLYFPWFWQSTAMGRASTLIHEAAHEYGSHIITSNPCARGASCDETYGVENANTFQIVFLGQAVDAYKIVPGTRELAVANYGDGTCGYVPILSNDARWRARSQAEDIFRRGFRVRYTSDNFIPAVRQDFSWRFGDPGPRFLYEIDRLNNARWLCDAVCQRSDYDTGGRDFCDETAQPDNFTVNLDNRALCQELAGRATGTLTASQLAALRDELRQRQRRCIPGYSPEYLAQQCTNVMATATSVHDIEDMWPELQESHAYNEHVEIRRCQARFCEAQARSAWRAPAEAACFEWDDTTGCLAEACGNLNAIERRSGRASVEYAEAVACRQSEFMAEHLRLGRGETHCEREYDRCLVTERYADAWRAQVENPTLSCWHERAGLGGGDAFYQSEYAWIGTMPATAYLANTGSRGEILQSPCMLMRAVCEATHGAEVVTLSKWAIGEDESTSPKSLTPISQSTGYFDQTLLEELGGVAMSFGAPTSKPFARDPRLQRLEESPDVTAALFDTVGPSTFVRSGASRFAVGRVSPHTLALFTSPAPPPDPRRKEVPAVETDVDALGALVSDLESTAGRDMLENASSLSPETLYSHYEAFLTARTVSQLTTAYSALSSAVTP